MSNRMAAEGFTLLSVAMAFFVSSCSDESCQRCDLSGNGYQVCPEITKQCSFGTIVSQQCSGSGGASSGCCATSPDQISCNVLADQWNGQYRVVDGFIWLEVATDKCLVKARIDPVASGWITDTMSEAEQERVIGDRMTRFHMMRKPGG